MDPLTADRQARQKALNDQIREAITWAMPYCNFADQLTFSVGNGKVTVTAPNTVLGRQSLARAEQWLAREIAQAAGVKEVRFGQPTLTAP
jgi:hypothetical protein